MSEVGRKLAKSFRELIFLLFEHFSPASSCKGQEKPAVKKQFSSRQVAANYAFSLTSPFVSSSSG